MHSFQAHYELLYVTDLVITKPPQDDVVCIGDKVNITCGYEFGVPLAPVWIIGGQTYSVSDIMNSSLYNSPMVDTADTVLTIYSAIAPMNRTTFQCEFTVKPIVMSSVGILTVMGKVVLYACKCIFS